MNIRKIAELSGVSVASVSRALSKDNASKVSAKKRFRILKVCDENRYYPNVHMVRIYRKRANTVGFLVPQDAIHSAGTSQKRIDENLGASILGAEEELSESSTFLTLAATSKKFVGEKEHIKFCRSKMVDGILIWGWTEPETYIYDLINENIPLVMLQGKPENEDVNFVSSMDGKGSKMILDYVFARGHRKISIVTPFMGSFIGRERFYGTLAALKKHNLEAAWVSSCQGYSIEIGYKACMEILEKSPETTCIIGANDLTALGVIKAAREMKISVPEELSVTGADGVDLYQTFTLTTYFSDSYEIGRVAARLLKSVIDEPGKAPERIEVPVQFIRGDTVRKR
jgi:LacI family transcriptional regulator